MDPLLPVGDGHTALSEEDREGLIPTYIATLGDLFAAEEANIARALLRRRPPSIDQILDDKYLRNLHRSMFEDVWVWAGSYRRLETNIGIDPSRIPVAVRSLVDDAKTWVDSAVYDSDEIAVRFHHQLVFIHPFPNGNGRHGRIAADYLVSALGSVPFTWGRHLDADSQQLRDTYRHALVHADRGDLGELLNFART
jgi:Fic-DOC domain mobile mystery protein B